MKSQMIAVCLGFLGLASVAQADRNACEARALEVVKSHLVTRFKSIDVKPVIIGRDYQVSVNHHENYDVQFPNGCGSRAIVSERSLQMGQLELSPILNALNAPGASDSSSSTNSAIRDGSQESASVNPLGLGAGSDSTEAL
jgi:hypothetical protein